MNKKKQLYFSAAVLFIAYLHYPLLFDHVRVCENVLDYYNPFSEKCWYDLTHKLNVTEIVRNVWNFTAEEYSVTTEDGYTLLVVRCYQKITKSNPIVFSHGALHNSRTNLIKHKESTVHFLISQGYEVWLTNYRGTVYSRKHKKYTIDQEEFWDFSYHELGYYDLPAILRQVKYTTNQKAIFIGTSLAGTVVLVYTSARHNEADKYLAGTIMFGAAANFKNSSSCSGALYIMNTFKATPGFYSKGVYFLENSFINIFSTLASHSPLVHVGFVHVLGFLVGPNPKQTDWKVYPVLFSSCRDVATEKTVAQLKQNLKSEKFQYYDYGKDENLKIYGQEQPPLYPIDKINVPLTFFNGKGDTCTPIEDVRKLYEMLPDNSRCGFHIISEENWNHADFIVGKDIMEHVNIPILGYLDKMTTNSCVP